MEMNWHDLLFAHWPVKLELLRPLIPARLQIDCFDGEAWIGIVPFWMSGVRVRPFPGVPGTSRFPEINVLTYVTEGSKPGVFFFSLDAASWLAVKAAQTWYHLPYYHAHITSQEQGDEIVYRSSRRVQPGEAPADCEVTYRPAGEASCGGCGDLAHWLTERYCLYSTWRGRVYRADIHHAMWPLHTAEADFRTNTMTAPLGIEQTRSRPLLHLSKRLYEVARSPRMV
jgi:uncharacterized protein YqjF (DUF2071 family)